MANNLFQILNGANLGSLAADPSSASEGDFYTNSVSHTIRAYLNAAWRDVVTADATQTLTHKTLTGNTAANLVSGSGTLTLNTTGTVTLPNSTDTLVGKTTTDTLTNKTLTAPVIAQISNTGTITLPTTTDTLVGRTTTDTLLNKTIAFASNTFTGQQSIANGGTGQSTALAAFEALSPMTTKGDIETRSASDAVRVAIGTDGQVLTADSTQTAGLKWASQIGTVTSVTFTGDGTVLSSTPSSAVTSSGTLTAALATQAKNIVLAGPASGSNATPTFRALVAADIPQPSLNYQSSGASLSLTTNQYKSSSPHFTTPNVVGSLWKLSGSCFFNGSTTSVALTNAVLQWSSADGANSSSPPTAQTTTFGNTSTTFDINTSTIFDFNLVAPEIVLGPNITVYLVPKAVWGANSVTAVIQMMGIRIQ